MELRPSPGLTTALPKRLKDRSTERPQGVLKKHYLKYLKDRSRYTIFDEKTAFFHSRLRGAREPFTHFGKRQQAGRNRQKPAKTGRSFGAL